MNKVGGVHAEPASTPMEMNESAPASAVLDHYRAPFAVTPQAIS